MSVPGEGVRPTAVPLCRGCYQGRQGGRQGYSRERWLLLVCSHSATLSRFGAIFLVMSWELWRHGQRIAESPRRAVSGPVCSLSHVFSHKASRVCDACLVRVVRRSEDLSMKYLSCRLWLLIPVRLFERASR